MPTIPDVEIQAASYRYLRIGLIALLLALGAAVGYQSGQQGFALASVSAYYYTPAQAIFVSALIGLGVCMIALQGLTNDEDVFLNLGGMFAMVVAVVPTSRGADFDTALRACRKVGGTLNQGVAGKPDCPSVLALQNATIANVENNLTALLIVGGLALLLAAILLYRKRRAIPTGSVRWWVLGGFAAALLIWLGALVALLVSAEWLAGNAHYIAAAGLLACILLVAVTNARRRKSQQAAQTSPVRNPYAVVAVVMLAGAAVSIVLWLINAISLFWVEIVVALLFAIFWATQTISLEREASKAASSRPQEAVATHR
jgi:LPXTG-motif cell wall-anchored protein